VPSTYSCLNWIVQHDMNRNSPPTGRLARRCVRHHRLLCRDNAWSIQFYVPKYIGSTMSSTGLCPVTWNAAHGERDIAGQAGDGVQPLRDIVLVQYRLLRKSSNCFPKKLRKHHRPAKRIPRMCMHQCSVYK